MADTPQADQDNTAAQPLAPPSPDEVSEEGELLTRKEAAATPPIYEWDALEYPDHDRSPLWMVGFAAVTLVLGLFTFFVVGDWFGSLLVVALGVIIGYFATKKPENHHFYINEYGVNSGENFHLFDEFVSYAILEYQNGVTIEFDSVKRFNPRVIVPINPDDVAPLVGMVDVVLPRQSRSPDLIDRMNRYLKL